MEWAEQKQAGKTPAHAAVISNNILSLLGSKKSTITYKGSVEMVLLTNGKVWSILSLTVVRLTSVCSPLDPVMLGRYGESRLEVGLLRPLNRRHYLLA